jgi:hypothetical protein
LRHGRACTAGCSGPATSAARGTGTHCCTKYAAETKSAVPYGTNRDSRDLTAHAGSKVHLAALQHVATRLGIVASMGLWWPPRRCLM